MALLEKHLQIKRSGLKGAGKGLFTKVRIPRGTRIVEYKGEIMTWKEVKKLPDERNGYIFYFTGKRVIDAWNHKGFAHLANDARGIIREVGVKNNSEYFTEGNKCYIIAKHEIPARSEIFVEYGAEYWQAVRENIRSLNHSRNKRKTFRKPS